MTLFYESANELAQSDESNITFEIYQDRYQDIRRKQAEIGADIEGLKLLYDRLKKRLIKDKKIIANSHKSQGLRKRRATDEQL